MHELVCLMINKSTGGMNRTNEDHNYYCICSNTKHLTVTVSSGQRVINLHARTLLTPGESTFDVHDDDDDDIRCAARSLLTTHSLGSLKQCSTHN